MQTSQAKSGLSGDKISPVLAKVKEAANCSDDWKREVGTAVDDGFVRLSAGSSSERMVQEHLQDITVGDGDSHLEEFSEALQAVAKSLRQVAESKARALDEAAEWKLKYELELERSKQLDWSRFTDFTPDERLNGVAKSSQDDSDSQGRASPSHWSGHCCSARGICKQQIIREQSKSSAPSEGEKGDGSFRSEKSPFRLAWGSDFNKSRRHEHDTVSFERGNITTLVHGCKQITLQWDAPPQSVFILTKPDSAPVAALFAEMVRWLRDTKGVRVYVESSAKEQLRDSSLDSCVLICEEITLLHTKVDLVITLGGDGTVLWAANLFKGPMPPLVSFAMGSLGFMTQYLESERYQECLEAIMRGPVFLTLRHRLHCHIIRTKDGDETDCTEDEDFLVLNEVSIDRGMSAYLTNLECYCDNFFLTCVQGDGLILSTPSGSTAYSLAAGGSMVHPQVSGILFTPICPHSLSFRPLILPEYVTLRVLIPNGSRGQAWVSFDGKERKRLTEGDALIVRMSLWPVPAACEEESTHSFLRSVRDGLHWNLRKSQLQDGPRDIL